MTPAGSEPPPTPAAGRERVQGQRHRRPLGGPPGDQNCECCVASGSLGCGGFRFSCSAWGDVGRPCRDWRAYGSRRSSDDGDDSDDEGRPRRPKSESRREKKKDDARQRRGWAEGMKKHKRIKTQRGDTFVLHTREHTCIPPNTDLAHSQMYITPRRFLFQPLTSTVIAL